MTKRFVGEEIWLVEQPDHARAAGYLAAHWGNDEFARAGSFGVSSDHDFWREQVLFAVSEHDNGWWDWEADPEIDPNDGLPLDFLQLRQEQALSHWRIGTRRFAETHPFAAMLISAHARLLQEPMITKTTQPQLLPPFFRNLAPEISNGGSDSARTFVVEQQELESGLLERATFDAAARIVQEQGIADPLLHFPKRGIPPDVPLRQDEFVMPHIRLLQIADALSLLLCFGGRGLASIEQTPRGAWDDRVTLEIRPQDRRRIALKPYPFSRDPLPVSVPTRILRHDEQMGGTYLAWREGTEKQALPFEFVSG